MGDGERLDDADGLALGVADALALGVADALDDTDGVRDDEGVNANVGVQGNGGRSFTIYCHFIIKGAEFAEGGWIENSIHGLLFTIVPATLQLKKGSFVGKASPPSSILKSSMFPSSKIISYEVQKFKWVTSPIGSTVPSSFFMLMPRMPGGYERGLYKLDGGLSLSGMKTCSVGNGVQLSVGVALELNEGEGVGVGHGQSEE